MAIKEYLEEKKKNHEQPVIRRGHAQEAREIGCEIFSERSDRFEILEDPNNRTKITSTPFIAREDSVHLQIWQVVKNSWSLAREHYRSTTSYELWARLGEDETATYEYAEIGASGSIIYPDESIHADGYDPSIDEEVVEAFKFVAEKVSETQLSAAA